MSKVIGVHQTHCCKTHGCKYGDENCPVFNGTVVQDYPCESCINIVPVYRLTKEKLEHLLLIHDLNNDIDLDELLDRVEAEADYSEYGT